MGSITGTIRRSLVTKPWKPPTIEAPFPINPGELHELGVDRSGRHWYRHALGELHELPRTVTDPDDVLPNKPLIEVSNVDGVRTYRQFVVLEPGSYQRTLDAIAAAQPPKPRAWPMSALASVNLLTVHNYRNGGTRVVRGCSEIVKLLTSDKYGVEFHKAPDGKSVVPWAPGGDTYVVHSVDRLMPLVGPYVRDGVEPDCFGGCGRKAIDLARGWPMDLPWCGKCSGERAA